MRFARVAAIFGGVLLAAALAGEARAVDIGLAVDTGFAVDTGLKATVSVGAAKAGHLAPLDDLDKLRAQGPGEEGEPSAKVREASGPILLIFLLQQNRFADGIDVLQPITGR